MNRILPDFLNSSKGTSSEHAARLLYDGVLAQLLYRTYSKASLLPDPHLKFRDSSNQSSSQVNLVVFTPYHTLLPLCFSLKNDKMMWRQSIADT